MRVSIVSESAIEFCVIHIVVNKEIPNIMNRQVSFLQYCSCLCALFGMQKFNVFGPKLFYYINIFNKHCYIVTQQVIKIWMLVSTVYC
jgi:hypothetical protein